MDTGPRRSCSWLISATVTALSIEQITPLRRTEAPFVTAAENQRFLALLRGLVPDDWAKSTDRSNQTTRTGQWRVLEYNWHWSPSVTHEAVRAVLRAHFRSAHQRVATVP